MKYLLTMFLFAGLLAGCSARAGCLTGGKPRHRKCNQYPGCGGN